MISVVITVYNREDYVGDCLDSVLRQTCRDMEILCVDDQSTDRSYEILQQYAARDSRIRLFRNERNSGVQTSRNLALAKARGEYITFIDDDDWISDDCLEACAKEFAANPDVDTLCLREVRVRPDGSQYSPVGMKRFGKISGEQAFLWSMPWQLSGCYVTRTALQRQFPFDNTCRAFGDENTGRQILLHSRQVMQSQGTYYYRMLPVSVSHGINMGQFTRLQSQAALAGAETIDTRQKGLWARVNAQYETFRWKYVINACMYYYIYKPQLTQEQCTEALRIIRETRHTIDYSLLPETLKRKFGYRPLLGHWHLFRLQETLYFSLRKLIGRLKINEDGDPQA